MHSIVFKFSFFFNLEIWEIRSYNRSSEGDSRQVNFLFLFKKFEYSIQNILFVLIVHVDPSNAAQ